MAIETKLRRCACGCGGTTKTGEFLKEHRRIDMLDKSKIEQVLTNSGLSTARAKNLSEVLAKSDLFVNPETSGTVVVTEDLEEVVSSSRSGRKKT